LAQALARTAEDPITVPFPRRACNGSMAAPRALCLLALAALSRGELEPSVGQADCRNTLAGLRTRTKFEVAALCRSSLPTDICEQAMQELGPAPWTSKNMHSACSRWESEWALAIQSAGRSLESATMDDVTETKAPTPVPTPSPWHARSPGINAFTVPGLLLSKASKDTPFEAATAATPEAMAAALKTYTAKAKISASDMKIGIASGVETFPESLPAETVVGSLKMKVSDMVLIPHDLAFQKAVTNQVAEFAGVDPSKLEVTSVELLPKLDDLGVAKISGEVQVFFVVTGEDAADAAEIAKKLRNAKTQVLSLRIWHDMTAAGSNQHSLLVESLDARSASDDEEPEKPPLSASKGEDVGKDLKANVPNTSKKAKEALNAAASKTLKQADEKAKSIKNATAELAKNVANGTAEKAGKAKDKLKDAVEGFKALLGKKPELSKKGKAEDVLVDAEFHQDVVVTKNGPQSATASWASTLLAAAAVCSMAVFAAGKLWRRRAVSQRMVASRGSNLAPEGFPSLPGYDDCEGLE